MTALLNSLQETLVAELRRTAPASSIRDDQISKERLGALDLPMLALLITSWGAARYLSAYLKALGEKHAKGEGQGGEVAARLKRIEQLLERLDDGRNADREAVEDAIALLKGEMVQGAWPRKEGAPFELLVQAGWSRPDAVRSALHIATVLQRELRRLLEE